MRRSLYFAVALLFVTAGRLALGVTASSNHHTFGDFVVTVSADPSATLTAADYQVTVETADLLVSRLTAPYQGTLSNSFVADLDHDGGFEVVVTYSGSNGRDTGIKVYTWKDYRLQPVKLAGLDESQAQGYRGDDEFAVINANLVRLFQVYQQRDGQWSPTSTRRQLRYSFEHSRWTTE